ncbi:hypothetical protein D3C81_1270840 [compost metagenome]
MQASCGVLAEHQVLSVGQGESLFVCAFHCGLNRCPQAGLYAIDQFGDWQHLLIAAQPYLDMRATPLAMGRRHDAFGTAKPLQHGRFVDLFSAEMRLELLLNQLAGKRSRARAGRGVGHGNG